MARKLPVIIEIKGVKLPFLNQGFSFPTKRVNSWDSEFTPRKRSIFEFRKTFMVTLFAFKSFAENLAQRAMICIDQNVHHFIFGKSTRNEKR